ncbi:MAG TPA: nitrate ABC transporter permease, partial [Acidimicrobiales bacterium]|nr:nitrate ABC transporter permease [Acidimicrobiales bacterium]
AVAGAALLLALWHLASLRSPPLPTPADTFSRLREMLADPFYDRGPNDKGIGRQLLISLRRVGTGFAAATAVGVPLGLAIGASRRAFSAVNPIVSVLRPVSPLAWFPIWLTVTRDADQASVFVIFITALWPTVINTAAAAGDIPIEQQNVARVFRFGRLAYLRHVLIPNSLGGMVTGMRLSMGIAWMVIVAVEMLSGGTGIGFFVWDAYNAGSLEAVTAAIIIIGGVGVALDVGFQRLGRRVSISEVRS